MCSFALHCVMQSWSAIHLVLRKQGGRLLPVSDCNLNETVESVKGYFPTRCYGERIKHLSIFTVKWLSTSFSPNIESTTDKLHLDLQCRLFSRLNSGIVCTYELFIFNTVHFSSVGHLPQVLPLLLIICGVYRYIFFLKRFGIHKNARLLFINIFSIDAKQW